MRPKYLHEIPPHSYFSPISRKNDSPIYIAGGRVGHSDYYYGLSVRGRITSIFWGDIFVNKIAPTKFKFLEVGQQFALDGSVYQVVEINKQAVSCIDIHDNLVDFNKSTTYDIVVADFGFPNICKFRNLYNGQVYSLIKDPNVYKVVKRAKGIHRGYAVSLVDGKMNYGIHPDTVVRPAN